MNEDFGIVSIPATLAAIKAGGAALAAKGAAAAGAAKAAGAATAAKVGTAAKAGLSAAKTGLAKVGSTATKFAAKGGSSFKSGNIGANTIKSSKFMDKLKKGKKVIDRASDAYDVVDTANKLTNQKKEKEMAYNESVQLHDVDGNLTHEIIDVVTPPPLGNKDDEALQTRLWSQVAANLDTLGEMYGMEFNVATLKEKKKLDPVGKEDADVDNDGKVDDSDSYLMKRRKAIAKAMKKEETEVAEDKDPCWDTHKQVGMKKKGGKMVPNCVPKNESFNIKSPVSFTKPEEKIEEGVSEEQFKKHSPAILEAHWTMFENREYSHNPEKYHDSEGYDKKLERHKPYRKRSRAARMRDPERGIDSPAFKEFMRSRGM